MKTNTKAAATKTALDAVEATRRDSALERLLGWASKIVADGPRENMTTEEIESLARAIKAAAKLT
jgi:hypothetical protein